MSGGREFEEEFLREGEKVLKKAIPKLVDVWEKMGIPADLVRKRIDSAKIYLEKRLMKIIEKEQDFHEETVEEIACLERKHHQLCTELGTDYTELRNEIPLWEAKNLLEEKIAQLDEEKEERIRLVKTLLQEEKQLCSRLNTDLSSVNWNHIPTSEQLNILQEHISRLKNEEATRQASYVALRYANQNAMLQLEMSARSSLFEVEMFVNDDPQTVSLSDADMTKIKELNEKLNTQVENKKEILLKVQRRDELWEQMEEIEARGRDPSRLFANRGCALLEDEKKRKKILKELGRVEEQLKDLMNNYEQSHEYVLLINGKDYRQLIADQWANREMSKEKEKLQKQQDKNLKRAADVVGRSNSMKRHCVSSKEGHKEKQPKSSARPIHRPTEVVINQHSTAGPSTLTPYSAFVESISDRVQSTSSPNDYERRTLKIKTKEDKCVKTPTSSLGGTQTIPLDTTTFQNSVDFGYSPFYRLNPVQIHIKA